MRSKVLGIVVCVLVLTTVIPVSATITAPRARELRSSGVSEQYKSREPIRSPDGSSYRVIMFCGTHQWTMDWISRINQSGFDKAWRSKFQDLTIFFLLPFTKVLFGLNDFRNWYMELLVQRKHVAEFQDFLQHYDTVNGSGMITYLWLSGTMDRPADFKAQPDFTYVNNSWILNGNGSYIPNPKIWSSSFLWHFDFP